MNCVVSKIVIFVVLVVGCVCINQASLAQDEFLPFNDSNPEKEVVQGDEFESFEDDEFESFEETENSHATCQGEKGCCGKSNRNLIWVAWILGFTVLSGIFVRIKRLRNFRGVFLIASLVILGFYRGACPCPISSMQNLFLGILGVDINWNTIIWFVALIPITYILGRVYCGWICHLGALQEFIYLPGRFKTLQSAKAQRVLRVVRIIFLVLLIVQLIITRTNLFKHYDPFKVAFNLIGTNTVSWILLGILLISSVLIYRPFCKAVCPIGLILGWVSKIPGASVVGHADNCLGCKSCNGDCKIRAITRDDKFSKLDNQECISCGECMSGCKVGSLKFFRNNKGTHHDKIVCKREDI